MVLGRQCRSHRTTRKWPGRRREHSEPKRARRRPGDAEKQRGLRPRAQLGHPRCGSLARAPRVRRPGVPILQRRDVPSLHRQLQTPDGGRATSARAPTAKSSRAWSALGREPGRHERTLHQGSSSPARPSLRANHAHVRAPRLACTTAFSRVCVARFATSRQRAKRKALSRFAKCPTSLVAGARYAQRCPVEFGMPMEVVIAA